jgi:hypothetical protein
MANDIRDAFPGESRIKIVMCGQGTLGVSGGNSIRLFGGTSIDTDATFIACGGGDPVDHVDCWGWAGYFLASPTFDTANLTTLAAEWAAAATPDEKEAVCAQYAEAVESSNSYNENLARYRDTLLPAYASALLAEGKFTVMYEGGWDKTVTGGTDELNDFLKAVKRSRAWARILRTLFEAFKTTDGAFMPSDYIMLDERWGHAYPDLYSTLGYDGGPLDEAWTQIGLYNTNRRRVRIKFG